MVVIDFNNQVLLTPKSLNHSWKSIYCIYCTWVLYKHVYFRHWQVLVFTSLLKWLRKKNNKKLTAMSSFEEIHYSTEMALMSNLLSSVLFLLDFTAASDTADHNILLQILEYSTGIAELVWIIFILYIKHWIKF